MLGTPLNNVPTRGSQFQSDLYFSFAAVQLTSSSCLLSVQLFCSPLTVYDLSPTHAVVPQKVVHILSHCVSLVGAVIYSAQRRPSIICGGTVTFGAYLHASGIEAEICRENML